MDSEQNPEKEVKPQPIVLHANYNYKKLINIGNTINIKGINIKLAINNTILYTNNKNDFTAMKTALAEEKETL